MEITNKKERNTAFFQFIIIFLGSIIIVNLALFFDYTFPTKQIKALKIENAALKQNKGSNADLQQFYFDIEAIVNVEDSYIPRKKVDEIESLLSKARKQFPDNDLVEKVNSICYKLVALNSNLGDVKETLSECKNDLRKCRKDFNDYKEDF
ncbi:MAG: type VI secretion system TssO [Bacteroidota bacterium]|nr:type VI secretion system TssO [Bacteroidota bacterium]